MAGRTSTPQRVKDQAGQTRCRMGLVRPIRMNRLASRYVRRFDGDDWRKIGCMMHERRLESVEACDPGGFAPRLRGKGFVRGLV